VAGGTILSATMLPSPVAHTTRPCFLRLARILSASSSADTTRMAPLLWFWQCQILSSHTRLYAAATRTCSARANGASRRCTCSFGRTGGLNTGMHCHTRKICGSGTLSSVQAYPHSAASGGRSSLPHQGSSSRPSGARCRPQVLCESQRLKTAQISRTKKRATARPKEQRKAKDGLAISACKPRPQQQDKPELNEQVAVFLKEGEGKALSRQSGDHALGDFAGGSGILHFDGGSRGNPGRGGWGAVLLREGADQGVSEIAHGYGYVGDNVTSNECEYLALIHGLRMAKEHELKSLTVKGDSNLVISQLQGVWKVRAENLIPIYEEARVLIDGFDHVTLEHVPRKLNERADFLANCGIDSG